MEGGEGYRGDDGTHGGLAVSRIQDAGDEPTEKSDRSAGERVQASERAKR